MSRLFWENKAQSYPLPFEETTLLRTNRIIGLMEKMGLSIEGSRILDIGCGPGTFALPLAEQGAVVTALDISGNMLGRLKTEARRREISGVKTIRASWKDLSPVEKGLAERFDIVFSALSIAIQTEEDIRKMEQCSQSWCVCVAAGRIRYHILCRMLLDMFGLPLDPRPDIRGIREILEQMGRPYSYESFPVVTGETKTIPELAEDVAKRLEAQGKEPDRRQILDAAVYLFAGIEKDGLVKCTGSSDKGILVWRGSDHFDETPLR